MSEVDQPDGEHVTLISNGHRWKIPRGTWHPDDRWSCDNCGINVSPSAPASPCPNP